MELLLLSNSTNHGGRMYAHAAEAFAEVAAGSTVAFIPFALAAWDDYAYRAEAAFASFGVDLVSVHRAADPAQAILEADVVMMGGGNTFRLLDTLAGLGVLDGLGRAGAAGDDPVPRSVGGDQRGLPDDPDHQRHADLPAAQLRRPRADPVPDQPPLRRPRSRRRRSWARRARSGSASSSRRTRARCWPSTRARGSGCRQGTATVTGPSRLFQRSSVEAFDDGVDISHLLDLTPRFDRGTRPYERARPLTAGAAPIGVSASNRGTMAPSPFSVDLYRCSAPIGPEPPGRLL